MTKEVPPHAWAQGQAPLAGPMGGSPGSGDWWLHPSPWCQLEPIGHLPLFVLTKLTGWQRAGSTTAQHTGRDRGADVLPRVQQDTCPGEASARSKQD